MSKETKKIDALSECCEVVVSIQCSKCRCSDSRWMGDEYSAAEEFYKKGWRSTANNTYCPKCSKKYLKK